MNKFNIGDKVLFCYCYGDTYSGKHYRFGEVKEGVIADIHYVEARNSYLYNVRYDTKFEDIRVSTRLLNERWIFNLNERDKALEALEECCDSIDR